MKNFPSASLENNTALRAEPLAKWVEWGQEQLEQAEVYFGHGTDSAWMDALWLALWLTGQTWEQLEISPEEVGNSLLSLQQQSVYRQLIRRRIDERLPVAYLTGEAYFAGLRFKVNQDVLVPRSPIAELIQRGFQPWLRSAPQSVLDLCTGSACIGIACAKRFPASRVIVSDISAPALDVAKQNIALHNLQDRLSVLQSDLFDGFDTLPESQKQFDLIVSNPPYVDKEDLANMPDEYRTEPEVGLAAGDDGLAIVRRILSQSKRYLNPSGLLVVEVGNSWQALEQAFPRVEFTWPEFEQGGYGVFILGAEQVYSL